ncbi:MAG: dTMP kinase [Proteobacteria bacterium]|nr:dTMP kinase [Pseudomonadota bacterium]
MTPQFITLEGGEGTGKSTQAKRLAAKLGERGIDAIVTREPGGSAGAEQIRELFVHGEPGRWSALTETLLVFAARVDHVEKTIKPALASGKWVICDRFTDSTYAYQGVARGTDREIIRRVQSAAIGDFKPGLTLVLDLPVSVGLERAKARSGSENRFEQFDAAFHEKLRQAFLDIAKKNGDRCVVIDASGSEEHVAELIWQTAAKRFSL